VYNSTTGLFTYANVVPARANQYINGDCSLPGETTILSSRCLSSVSIFTVDYDAPLRCHPSPDVRTLLEPLFQYANSSTLVGGSNGTTVVYGNSTTSSNGTAVSSPTSTVTYTGPSANVAGLVEVPWLPTVLGIVVAAMFYV
jgi:5'-nucleotidase